MRRFLLYVGCLLVAIQAFGKGQPLAVDTSTVQVRSISIATYTADKAFNYSTQKAVPLNAWDRFWRSFWQWVNHFINAAFQGNIVSIGIIILAVALIVFVVWRITGMSHSKLFSNNNAEVSNFTVSQDDINAIDFAAAINQAAAQGNYRLAIRLLYLQTLKLLADKKYIQWQLNKTNAAYVSELAGRPQQQLFAQLTFFFDKSWYGEESVEESRYLQLLPSFHQFQQQLQ